jgi:hypothetical protein
MPTKKLPKRKQGEARWVAHDPSWWEQLTTPLLDKPAQPGPAILHYLSSPLDIASGVASLGTSAVVAPAVRAAARVPSAVVNAIEATGSAPLMGEGMREFLGGVRDRDPWAAITGLGQTALGGLGISPASQDAWTVLTRPGTSTGRSRPLAGTTLGYQPSRRGFLGIPAVQDTVDSIEAQKILTGGNPGRDVVWVTDDSGVESVKVVRPRYTDLNPELSILDPTAPYPKGHPQAFERTVKALDLLDRTEEIVPVKIKGSAHGSPTLDYRDAVTEPRLLEYETTPLNPEYDFNKPWITDAEGEPTSRIGPWVMEAERADPTVKDALGHLRNWFNQRVIKDIAAETATEAGKPVKVVLEEVQKQLDELAREQGPVGRIAAELQKRFGRR